VLIGRRDPSVPIASLRAHRQVTEIRTGDLRFTPQEAAQLLGQMLDRDIDEAVAEEWTKKTEGWVTALRLAALSLRHRDSVDNLRADIQGDSRYLREYLLAEVLAHLPPVRRDWLLLTSLLDRFCAPLCEAVGRSEVVAEPADRLGVEFIRWLQEDNLFLVPLDDRFEWFRFHHLFQQLLQDRLQEHLAPQEIAAAHRRASKWFAEQRLIGEAIRHALAAGDVQTAAHLVERHRYHLMNTEQWHRLERRLKLLPAEAVAQNPLLMSTKAYIALYRGQDKEQISSFQRAEQLLADLTPGTREHEAVQGEIGVIYALWDIAGQPIQAVNRAQNSLELLPPEALHIRSIAILTIALGLQMQGDLKGGVVAIRETLAEQAWPDGLQAKMMHFLCMAYIHEGDLTGVLSAAHTGLSMADKLLLPETLRYCRYDKGIAHYLRDEFTRAEPILRALLEDRATSAPHYAAQGAYALALIYQALGRTAEAAQVLQLIEDHLRETKDTLALTFTEAFRVELALRQGELSEARRLSKGVEFELRPPIWFFYVPQLTPLRLLLTDGTAESLAEANARLAALGAEMRRINRKNVLIDVLALQALVCDAQGDEQTALEKLCAALELGRVGGNIRSFADLGPPMANLLCRYRYEGMAGHSDASPYVDRILAAFGPATEHEQPVTTSATTGPSSPLVLTESGDLLEPLTRRELEVLALLAQQLTYKEIGEELFISHGTVGQHVVRIHQKLQVNNRRQAVAKALALGILSQQ